MFQFLSCFEMPTKHMKQLIGLDGLFWTVLYFFHIWAQLPFYGKSFAKKYLAMICSVNFQNFVARGLRKTSGIQQFPMAVMMTSEATRWNPELWLAADFSSRTNKSWQASSTGPPISWKRIWKYTGRFHLGNVQKKGKNKVEDMFWTKRALNKEGKRTK